MKNFLELSVIFLLFSSCSVNQILAPAENSNENRFFKWREGSDSLTLKFVGNNFQPEYKRNTQELELPFTIESVVFKSESGNVLNGWFLKPKNSQSKTTIFHLHGNAGNLSMQYPTIAELTKDGFQIFMFDYSGYGYSTGKATRKNCLVDSYSAFNYFLKNENVKNTDIIIYGQSLGGNLAISLAENEQEKIKGLVLEGTFLNMKNIANNYVPLIGGIIVKNIPNNSQYLKDYKKPILVIHSKDDRVIPERLGKKMYEKANEPKNFYEVTGNHINSTKIYHKEIANKINEMIVKSN